MDEPGNIDISRTPGLRGTPGIRVDPEDPRGGVSSVLSTSFQDDDGREALVPSVKAGKGFIDDPEAEYRKTGAHLGKFKTVKDADDYAEQLHLQQQRLMGARERAFGGGLPTAQLPRTGLGAGMPRPQASTMAHAGVRPPAAKLGMMAPHLAYGGDAPDLSPVNTPVSGAARQSLKELFHPGGLIGSPIAGRTDRIPMSVAADSYVLPADVVSGVGQSNSLAGARFLDHALKVGPWGTSMPKMGRGKGPPAPPPAWHPNTTAGGFAAGGVPKGVEPVKIVAAGGEYVVPPYVVKHHPFLGRGDMNRGHRVLDKFVKRVRSHTVKTLKNLPPPKKD